MNWRDSILGELPAGVARLTLVADPDRLLLDEQLSQEVRVRGYEFLTYSDNISFRFEYETRFRALWDRGELKDATVLVSCNSLQELPYDVLQAGRHLSFSLTDLFPGLSYPVISSLDPTYFDALFEAQRLYSPGTLGENATKEFILRHVFEIAPELIRHPSDLLRVLLRWHYRRMAMPSTLQHYLIQLLSRHSQFREWPLQAIVPDRQAFFAFLQERWPYYLEKVLVSTSPMVSEPAYAAELSYPGPMDLPFGHDDVRVYIDNLFLEGMLKPIPSYGALLTGNGWAEVGIARDPERDRERRLERLLGVLANELPDGSPAHYRDWLAFAPRWAEAIVLRDQVANPGDEVDRQYQELRGRLDISFTDWLLSRYAGLHNQAGYTPVMLHQIPRHLARHLEEVSGRKVALIVMDGLALDQWAVLRTVLASRDGGLHFEEGTAFAWVPTLTQISRQSIFSGRPPFYFGDSISRTDKEPAHWVQFWGDHGVPANEVDYLKGLGDRLDVITNLLSGSKVKVLGMVVDKVDNIMHGMELGTGGMHAQVRLWAERGFLNGLLTALLDAEYSIFLTADHGNVEAVGIGSPREASISDVAGSRVRVFSDESLLGLVAAKYPEAIRWPPAGLPDHYYPLIAPGRAAFTTEGKSLVTHGGVALEELIVPFVRIGREKSG